MRYPLVLLTLMLSGLPSPPHRPSVRPDWSRFRTARRAPATRLR